MTQQEAAEELGRAISDLRGRIGVGAHVVIVRDEAGGWACARVDVTPVGSMLVRGVQAQGGDVGSVG